MQKEHHGFEGAWELQADERRVAFSNLQSHAGRLPKVRHVVVTLTADGVEFNGKTTLWADVQQVNLSEPLGAKFSMKAVELIVDDKPKTIGIGFVPTDAQEWLLMAFQKVGGFSK